MPHPELDSLFRELLATNKGPGYAINVRHAAPDLSIVDVELRFIAGRSYCCAEPACHLPHDCRRILRLAAQRAVSLPESVTVRWHCYVEKGTRLDSLKYLGLPAESDPYDFEAISGRPVAG